MIVFEAELYYILLAFVIIFSPRDLQAPSTNHREILHGARKWVQL